MSENNVQKVERLSLELLTAMQNCCKEDSNIYGVTVIDTRRNERKIISLFTKTGDIPVYELFTSPFFNPNDYQQ